MISRLTAFARKLTQTQPIPSPESFIIQPKEAAKVSQLQNGRFHIQWQHPAETVHIYANNQPLFDENAQLWATVTDAQAVIVPPLPHTPRPYFILQVAKDDHFLVAERVLTLPNTLNFRDSGGYVAENGKQVRWGQLYRSGTLSHLTEADFAFFKALNLRTVFDLRSDHESQSAPDKLPHDPHLQHFLRPLSSAGTRREQVRALRHYRHRIGELLLHLYQQSFVDDNAHHIGDMLTRLADSAQRPALIHCSAGKDRTGLTIALLLTVLGVPEATIVADYSLSNLAYAHIAREMAPQINQARWLGIRSAKMTPLLLADPAYLQDTFSYIRGKYGTIEDYLCGVAGMAPQTLDKLREELLM